jgi:hypothetical protein
MKGSRFAADSMLEGDGFELPVPRHSRGFAQHSGHCGGIGEAAKRIPDGSALLLLRLEPLHRAGLRHGMWLAALRSGVLLGRPFCEFGPAVSDIELGVLGRHFDRAIKTDIDVSAREVCTEPMPGGACSRTQDLVRRRPLSKSLW